jgi:chorismate synthase
MNPWPVEAEVDEVHTPRPGHADLAGLLKFGHSDVRNVLERASARETAARVAAGALAKELLRAFGVSVHSHVVQIGSVRASEPRDPGAEDFALVDESPVRCLDPQAGEAMVAEIDRLRKANESLGGVFEVRAFGLVPGLGSHLSWETRLDSRLAQALVSIQAVKGVSVGEAWDVAGRPGSESHDEIFWSEERGWYRETNRAGGVEGGMSNGEPLTVLGALKPISTLTKPLRSVDTETKQPAEALRERTDSTVVPAAGVVGEAMTALVLARCYREKFGGDHIDDARAALAAYRERIGWRR